MYRLATGQQLTAIAASRLSNVYRNRSLETPKIRWQGCPSGHVARRTETGLHDVDARETIRCHGLDERSGSDGPNYPELTTRPLQK